MAAGALATGAVLANLVTRVGVLAADLVAGSSSVFTTVTTSPPSVSSSVSAGSSVYSSAVGSVEGSLDGSVVGSVGVVGSGPSAVLLPRQPSGPLPGSKRAELRPLLP